MYSPRLSDELIHQLWRLKQRTRIPMTKLLDRAVQNYLNSAAVNLSVSETEQKTDQKTELKTALNGQTKTVISS